jgi:site-specific recombinase XerD
MNPTDFALILQKYLREYLPDQRNASPNTIKSYAMTFSLLARHFEDRHGIPPDRLALDHLTADAVLGFLRDLESGRGSCISTRNQRLAAIRAFSKFVQRTRPERLAQCQRIRAISGKRGPKSDMIHHLTPERMKTLLAQPDQRTTRGQRDATLLSLLYDAGVRAQELVDLTPGKVRLDAPAQIVVTGKGRKRRTIPLMCAMVALLRPWMKGQGLDVPERRDEPLFRNPQGRRLTTNGIRHIVRKYAGLMPAAADVGQKRITPHTFRHSKAMHLLQSGNPLVVIQSFLGHEDIRTTETYARADLELTRAALARTPGATPQPGTPSWCGKPGLLEWLRQL